MKEEFVGASPFWACQADSRFSYCLYVPVTKPAPPRDGKRPLLVVVHGSGRVAESYRDRLADVAERTGCVVLSPLFPCGIAHADDKESYKFVYGPGIRYDLVLLAMVEEASRLVAIDTERFMLAGYSGGGQFAHRFFYGHADRLLAVSIGAPGAVTVLDPSKPWWVGIGGLEAHLGFRPDLEAMRRVKVQMVIGGADTEAMLSKPGSPHFMEGINESGRDRIERMASLLKSFRDNDIYVDRITVPGIAHDGFALLDPVRHLAESTFGVTGKG